MTAAQPIRYTADLETLSPDEAEAVSGINATFDTILQTTARDYGHAVRGVHAKAHGILDATLDILPDLPPALAQGLFARPGAHRALMRISTNPGDILDDAISVPRGLAIKVLDAAGERLPDADGASQDFIFINGPVFLAQTAKQFLGNLKLLAKTTDRAEGAKKAASAVLQTLNAALTTVGLKSSALQALGGAPNTHPLGETWFSATPFRYGDHVAKFRVQPVSPNLTALTGRKVHLHGRRDALREEIRIVAGEGELRWAFQVQLCRDLARQPVEDPTVEWKEEDTPFQTVATLTAQAQDSWDETRVREVNDGMRFSVWTGLDAHRPLGNVNRARRDVYRHSSDYRARVNGCPFHEPAARRDADV